MLHFIWNIFSFIISVSILITIHEFGHFFIARKLGVHVEKFSIGIGKVIWKTVDKKGTEYVISLLPIGGYIKMLNYKSKNITKEKINKTFDSKNFFEKLSIIIAGPLSNILFSIITFWFIFFTGIPGYKLIIKETINDSTAYKHGLKPGMEIKEINGIKVFNWNDFKLFLEKDSIIIKLTEKNNKNLINKNISLKDFKNKIKKQDDIIEFGIIPLIPNISVYIKSVIPGSIADKFGLKKNDKIIKINEILIKDSWYLLIDVVKNNYKKNLKVEIERNGNIIRTEIIKDKNNNKNIKYEPIGIIFKKSYIPEEYKQKIKLNFIDSFNMSLEKVFYIIKNIIISLFKLIIGDLNLNNISGPISMAKGIKDSMDDGFIHYVIFLSIISINLGIVNLMPIPILDGGHVVFLLIENITKCKIKENIQEIIYKIGAIIIITIMFLSMINDFFR
ncbi:yaeL [Wigglesworthia glossinidia endosymbiont of Glossina brevipalpis]|uniref:Zinc metalloprotease n=1 Tax=Wigglesworthia glossinidia brevipalpis TaxID=36870 RepID=Q8D2G9_WIGBR|nr:yaeL [Wigglesworthia glossinidia endosymbiont of Glossina brevipalpis]